MSTKRRVSPFLIYLIIVVIAVYAIWFIFFQDLIQFLLENAISTDTIESGPDPITAWFGIIFLPLLGVLAVLGITYLILLIQKKNKSKE
jgi:hypothetical protein